MLNVTAQSSSEGAKAYFAKSDYYSEGQELVGNWGGKGAVLLGLHGEVQKQDFERLCDNLDPQSGEQLTAINRGNRRVGYDFTWSAPKSVSVMHALTGDERIVKAFRDSIGDTMREMEGEMQTRVRKSGQDSDRQTGNWCYAEFVHLTSRPVKGVVCPQLHAHAFAFNATLDPVENKWKAGQFGAIKANGFYWQAVQQARSPAGCNRSATRSAGRRTHLRLPAYRRRCSRNILENGCDRPARGEAWHYRSQDQGEVGSDDTRGERHIHSVPGID